MTGAFFGAFVIEYQDPSVVRSCSDHVLSRNRCIGRNDGGAEAAFAELAECDGFVDAFDLTLGGAGEANRIVIVAHVRQARPPPCRRYVTLFLPRSATLRET